ncbi:hypothetical protein Plec18167_008517 [Paecilomyces lecythidis]|uniref:2-deoxyglucose-6-phosphate phosphatase n=1 Tax=Paecilomyces lecythidis TaxID=3004212 RepID=A0ABR3WVS0_9EURO
MISNNSLRNSVSHIFAGVLLDFDGTIIDSTEAIVENWRRVAKELNIDYQEIVSTSHGRRSIDVLRELDPSKANWDYVTAMESRIPYLTETSAVEIPGARKLLESLDRSRVPYAIVTSGSRALLDGWLRILHLPQPKEVIVAEDVAVGKPDPEGYRKAREKICYGNKTMGDILVIEDAPAGVKAGKDAGCKVLGVATTHAVKQLKDAGADWVVENCQHVQVIDDGGEGHFCFNFYPTL